jgi:molybdenum cofactor cytidylyltransferase
MNTSLNNPPNPSELACIVLAAGSGRRFGTDKRLTILPSGRTLLMSTLASVPPLFSKYFLVLKPGEETIASEIPAPWTVIFAQQAEKGIGYSLLNAMKTLLTMQNESDLSLMPLNIRGALVALADMPYVHKTTYEQISSAISSNLLVLPTYKAQRGNPVGIGSDFFAELAKPPTTALADQGARGLITKYRHKVQYLECDDLGILRDIDTPADLS